MKCIWCDKHQFRDKNGNEKDHHHWCSKYNRSCYSFFKLCNELTIGNIVKAKEE
jgi:hypothetical protein